MYRDGILINKKMKIYRKYPHGGAKKLRIIQDTELIASLYIYSLYIDRIYTFLLNGHV